jgi:hypothetical protein
MQGPEIVDRCISSDGDGRVVFRLHICTYIGMFGFLHVLVRWRDVVVVGKHGVVMSGGRRQREADGGGQTTVDGETATETASPVRHGRVVVVVR